MSRHWHVLGAGSMGCLFAAALAGAGCRVSLLLRPPLTARCGAVTVTRAEGDQSAAVMLDSREECGEINQLLVCTKAYDIADAVAGIGHRLLPASPIVLAANGMGYLDWFECHLRDNPLYCCLSTEGAYVEKQLHIRHAGRGHSLIGSPAGSAPPQWLEDWTQSELDVRWQDDISRARWQKLAINCAINPLAAVHRCRNGELARNTTLAAQLRQLCDEISAVSAAAGFADTADTLHQQVASVIANTAENRCSMLQDVLAGRATEIAYINGYLLRTAERLDVPAPLNRRLLREVSDLGHGPH